MTLEQSALPSNITDVIPKSRLSHVIPGKEFDWGLDERSKYYSGLGMEFEAKLFADTSNEFKKAERDIDEHNRAREINYVLNCLTIIADPDSY